MFCWAEILRLCGINKFTKPYSVLTMMSFKEILQNVRRVITTFHSMCANWYWVGGGGEYDPG